MLFPVQQKKKKKKNLEQMCQNYIFLDYQVVCYVLILKALYALSAINLFLEGKVVVVVVLLFYVHGKNHVETVSQPNYTFPGQA